MKGIRSQIAVGASVLGVVLIVMLLVVMPGWAAPLEEPEAAPVAAIYTQAWNTVAITQDTTTSGLLTQAYSYHDVFCAIDQGTTNTITVKLEYSPDDTNWFSGFNFDANAADASIFTRTLVYGRYTRMVLDVSNSNSITPTCKSIFSNNWMPTGLVVEQNQQ